jgi:UDP-glucose:(glucosyl)LPS alpha-1,2-glucosyltransferase
MSCIYKGKIVESELSTNSNGGTEMMRKRLLDSVSTRLLEKYAIHFSRSREMYTDVKNIFYCHDLAQDPENNMLANGGWKHWDHFVFVSAWQRDQYVLLYQIPYSKCTVIYNAVEKEYAVRQKDQETIRFIYHTTPHRGLELLVPIFDALAEQYKNIHLDVYSSFGIYGWENRDEPYSGLFKRIEAHPKMTYHGHKSNEEVLEALDKAHVFLYPNIWQETSCIALIEAIKSGVICVHPNYGALPETACNASIMYDYHEDINRHASFVFSIAKQLMDSINGNPEFFDKWTQSDRFYLGRNSMPTFEASWQKLLKDLDSV